MTAYVWHGRRGDDVPAEIIAEAVKAVSTAPPRMRRDKLAELAVRKTAPLIRADERQRLVMVLQARAGDGVAQMVAEMITGLEG